MAVTLTVNGVSFNYPTLDNEGWGQAATQWAQAVTGGMLQKAGGTFTLTAEVDFGASFGLKSAYYKSRTAAGAVGGEVRLANLDTINWRNAADTADLVLEVNPVNNHLLFDGFDMTSSTVAGNVIGPSVSTDNALPRFDGITGQLLKNSGVIVDNSNNVSGIAGLTTTGNTTLGGTLAAGTTTVSGSLIISGTLSSNTGDVQVDDNLVPAVNASPTLGTNSKSWGLVRVDRDTIDGGGVVFNSNAGDGTYMVSNAAGTQLQIGGFTSALVPAGVANNFWETMQRPLDSGGSRGIYRSAECTTFTDNALSVGNWHDVTNLSVDAPVISGRAIRLYLIASDTTNYGRISVNGTQLFGRFRLVEDGSPICAFQAGAVEGDFETFFYTIPPSVVSHTHFPSGSGTKTYKLQVNKQSDVTIQVQYSRLIAEVV